MKKLYLASVLCLSTLTAMPALANDVLVMQNGDRLSGDILFQSPKTIRFQTDYGVMYVPMAKIAQVESATQKLRVPQAAPTTPAPQATMPETPSPAPVAVITPTPEPTVTPDETPTLWGAKWNGEINVGAELETGNSDSETLTLDGKTTANWDDVHRLTIGADYNREVEDDVTVDDDREVYAQYDYFFADRWFWNNTASFQQNKVDDLESRIEATSGLGYQIFDQDDLTLEITFGPGYQREEFSGQDADSSLTANWTADYEQKFYDDAVRLFHNHDWTTPSDDFSAWLFESQTGVKMPIKGGIIATGEIDFDWNNNPPTGIEEDDTTYRLKLGYEWP